MSTIKVVNRGEEMTKEELAKTLKEHQEMRNKISQALFEILPSNASFMVCYEIRPRNIEEPSTLVALNGGEIPTRSFRWLWNELNRLGSLIVSQGRPKV